MIEINFTAVVVAAIAGFLVSMVWYMVFAKQAAQLSPAMANAKDAPAWKKLAEFGRSLGVSYVMAYFVFSFGLVELIGLTPLAVLVWFGFPLMILAGAVIWENMPIKLMAIHAGDWLVKLLVIVNVLGYWR